MSLMEKQNLLCHESLLGGCTRDISSNLCPEILAACAEPARVLTQPYIQWDIRLAKSLPSHRCTGMTDIEKRSIGPQEPQTLRRGSIANLQLNGHSSTSLESQLAVLPKSFVMRRRIFWKYVERKFCLSSWTYVEPCGLCDCLQG